MEADDSRAVAAILRLLGIVDRFVAMPPVLVGETWTILVAAFVRIDATASHLLFHRNHRPEAVVATPEAGRI